MLGVGARDIHAGRLLAPSEEGVGVDLAEEVSILRRQNIYSAVIEL